MRQKSECRHVGAVNMARHRYGLHGHGLAKCQLHHLTDLEYAKNPAKLNQFQVGSLLEIELRNRQLRVRH